jgi:hypothetical protein
VIQKATVATGPSTPVRLLIWAPLSALAAAVLTAIVLLVAARRDPRVRFRDDIADAVGSPVLAAVRSQPQVSVAGWSTLFGTYEATPVESWAYRQLLRGLVPSDRKGELRGAVRVDHPSSMTIISIGGDNHGLAIGPQLAAFASTLGISTHVVPASDADERATALWAACLAKRSSFARPGLHLGESAGDTAFDLTIVLTVVDRLKPSLRETPASAATILVVGAGTATEEELARVAVAVDDAGRRIDGIIVADPDQTDRTSGRHTMDERAHQAALPTRITGISPTRRLARDGHGGSA